MTAMISAGVARITIVWVDWSAMGEGYPLPAPAGRHPPPPAGHRPGDRPGVTRR
jgi:hypothetical protein